MGPWGKYIPQAILQVIAAAQVDQTAALVGDPKRGTLTRNGPIGWDKRGHF